MDTVELHQFDVVLTASDSWLGNAIRWATRDSGEKPTLVNHSGMILAGGKAGTPDDAIITEALGDGVTLRYFTPAYGDGQDAVAVFAPRNLTERQKTLMAAYARDHIGDQYGYGKLLVHAARKWKPARWLIDKIFPKIAIEDQPICSFYVAKIFEAAGLDFGVKSQLATPDDIWDFCFNNPDKYDLVIWPLQKLHLQGELS